MPQTNILEELKSNLLEQLKELGNASALESAKSLNFPLAKNEEWKYSPFSIPKNTTFQVLSGEEKSAFQFRNQELEDCHFLVFANGIFQASLSASHIEGIEIEAIDNAKDQSQPYENNIFNPLNLATAHLSGLRIKVKNQAVIEKPVLFLHIVSENGNAWIQPRIQMEVGEKANVCFGELWQVENQQNTVFNMVSEVEVKPSAFVKWISFEKVSKQTSLINQTRVEVREKAVFQHVVVALGEGFSRNNLEIRIHGEEGDAHMYGLTLGNQKLHVDHHTYINHKAENTTSNQLYKGIFSGKSTGVFNGKIFVDQAAQKTNAYQSSKNILISNDAKVFAKPQLEIFADDVKCSHGATIGQLDEEPIFYLRSRGLDEATAKHLLIQAFASEILMQIPHEPLRKMMEQEVLDEMNHMIVQPNS
jgi:Fe-S cluster assembly protein SufD